MKGGDTRLMDRMIKQILCILDLSCKIPYAKKKANIVERNAEKKELSILFQNARRYLCKTSEKTAKLFSP